MMTTRQQKQRRDHPTILYALGSRLDAGSLRLGFRIPVDGCRLDRNLRCSAHRSRTAGTGLIKNKGATKSPDSLQRSLRGKVYTMTEVYRQRDLPPAANCGRVVGVRTSGVLAQAALEAADGSTGAA